MNFGRVNNFYRSSRGIPAPLTPPFSLSLSLSLSLSPDKIVAPQGLIRPFFPHHPNGGEGEGVGFPPPKDGFPPSSSSHKKNFVECVWERVVSYFYIVKYILLV